MVAVLDRNLRGRGACRWLEAAVRVRGAVGRLGRSRGGVGEEWGWGGTSGRGRQRGREGKKREGGGAVQPWKCHAAWDGVVGPDPDRQVAPRPCPRRSRPGRGARGRRVTVRTAARWRRSGGPRWQRERGGAGGARARVGRPEKKAGWSSPDEQ
jgi:hypothetical protein